MTLTDAVRYMRIKADILERSSPNRAWDLRFDADDIEALAQPEARHPLDARIRAALAASPDPEGSSDPE